MRREVPALHDGGMQMLEVTNPNVLSYVRTAVQGGRPVVVVLNMSAARQSLSLHLPGQSAEAQKANTLVKSPGGADPSSLSDIQLAPFGVYIGEVQ
jgi:hypothetical protein